METIAEQNEKKGSREQRNVGGFLFYSPRDTLLAEQELKKIDYLEKRLDYSKTGNVLMVYKKAVQDRIFKTPVGFHYLKNMQQFLLEQNPDEEIPPITLYTTFDAEVRDNTSPARSRVTPSKKKQKLSSALPLSIFMNVALVLAVIAMFIITLNASQPNILNYERALTNRYANWEQELTEREQVIREKEASLKNGDFTE